MSLTDHQLIALADRHGTPLYLYDGDMILQRYRELHDYLSWPKLKIHYAMKANSNVAILKLLHEAGANLDTVSPAEVLLALKLGYAPDRILYTANNLTDEEMCRVQRTGVLMNIGSLSRLRKFGNAFPGSEVCLRFNPDVPEGGEFKQIQTAGDLTKFGILLQDLPEVQGIVAEHQLRVVGLHEHTGSGIKETEKVYQGIRNLMGVAIDGKFPDLRFLDFGGGFKIPYEPGEQRIDYASFGREITRLFEEFCTAYGRQLEMCFEPGKYIVGEAGRLLVRVNTLKNNRARKIAGTDSGFGHLIRPVLYGAYHEIVNLTNPDGDEKEYDVTGNLCETGDCFAVDRMLPEIREGDLLSINNAGAYCYSMGSVYNMRPLPKEVLVVDGNDRVVRKGLTDEELVGRILEESV